VVELRRPLPPHAGLRVRLRVRQPPGPLGVSPVPRTGAVVRRRLPGLPGLWGVDRRGRAGQAPRDGTHGPRLLGRRPTPPGRDGDRGRTAGSNVGAPGRRVSSPLRGEARIRSSPSTRGRGAPPPALRATSPLGGEDIGRGAGYPPRFCGEARIKSRPNTPRGGGASGSRRA